MKVISESLQEFDNFRIESFGHEIGTSIAEAISIENNKRLNEGVVALTLGTVLAMPAVIKIIGMGIKTGSKLFGKMFNLKDTKGEKAGEALKHFAHKMHEKLIQPIVWVLGKIPGVDKEKAEKWAKIIHAVIVALLGVYSGIEAVHAIKAVDIPMSAIEGALTAIKGTETGEALIASLGSSAGVLLKGIIR